MVVAASVGAARPAAACATCACGDPTLTVMGAEQPFEGRLRLSAAFDVRSEVVGVAAPITTAEQRLSLGLSYAALDWLQLAMTVPLARRRVVGQDLSADTVYNLGDLDLRARAILWRDQVFGPTHLLSVTAGLELPTMPVAERADGVRAPIAAQVGTASLDPLVGLSYAYFADPFSLYASSTVLIPTRGRLDLLAGPAWLSTVTAQLQPWPVLAFRLGLDARLDGPAYEGQVRDPDTGGFITFFSPEVVVSPLMDLVLRAALRLPVFDRLSGEHDEGPMVTLGVAYDL